MGEKTYKGGLEHLRAWREHLDLTRAELGERVGYKERYVYYVECQQRGCTLEGLRRFAKGLGIADYELLRAPEFWR
jgi:transcriptional regulator with XRE-family HTH domain